MDDAPLPSPEIIPASRRLDRPRAGRVIAGAHHAAYLDIFADRRALPERVKPSA